MNRNNWARQTHRWVSIAFTAAFIFNTVAVIARSYANWMGLLVFLPLFGLLVTGLYLFVLPYTAKWRGRRGAA